MRKLIPISLFCLLAVLAVVASAWADDAASGIKLTWQAPTDLHSEKVAGYHVYRSDKIMGHYEPTVMPTGSVGALSDPSVNTVVTL